MRLIVYVDLLFLLNTLVNVALLDCAGRFAGRRARMLRLVAGGAFGGAYAVAAAHPSLPVLAAWPCRLLCAAGMLAICYGVHRQLAQLGLWFAILSAAFAGVVLLLTAAFGTQLYLVGGTAVYPIRFSALAAVTGVCYGALGGLFRWMGARSAVTDLRSVTICFAGRLCSMTALMDNGNALRDPLTGRQVLVVDALRAKRLLPELEGYSLAHPAEQFAEIAASVPGARLIPYRTAGSADGLLLAARSDWALLGKRRYEGMTVAFSPVASFGGAFQVIAGGE